MSAMRPLASLTSESEADTPQPPGRVATSSAAMLAMASAADVPHIAGSGRRRAHTTGLSG